MAGEKDPQEAPAPSTPPPLPPKPRKALGTEVSYRGRRPENEGFKTPEGGEGDER
jgi:hypothetical protein